MKKRGEASFFEFYSKIYFSRWQPLFTSLSGEKKYAAKLNVFAQTKDIIPKISKKAETCDVLPGCFISSSFDPPDYDINGLKKYYLMDPASIIPPLNLGVNGNEKILDACAAPGGKTLILAELLKEGGELFACDLSSLRLNRLKKVLSDYLPENILKKIRILKKDVSKWCMYEREIFDRILMDVPCSSERHLIEKSGLMEKWSRARTKSLAIRQYALLISAFRLLKTKGIMVYSTCSISPFENDGVLRKLKKKCGSQVRIVEPLVKYGERTEFGWHILPDKHGFGPIYYSIVQKYDD